MSKSLFSQAWYRVADLKPRLRKHAQVHRQRYRGEVWYILQDHATGRFHRLSPAAHMMIGLMNGQRTVREIWEIVSGRLGEDLPTQDEVIVLLGQLYQADLLHGDVTPDIAELASRSDKVRRRELLLKLRNPLALRFPVFDPDRFLERTLPLVRPLFTRVGFLAWLALVGYAAIVGMIHWSELTENVLDRALATDSILVMLLAYPFIKALHELGHAYATKVWGGEVHEIGIMLLVLLPVPYVDASSSSAFVEKWRRAIVGGAGIMVELAIASTAMLVWLNLEPGPARAVAFNIILIGTVSTVFFNGNPLLRFDGYYVLADLIEIPNFATRANKLFFYHVKRHVFAIQELTPPPVARGERRWLLGYAVASFCYRVTIVVAIALFVASKLFAVGVLLALWALVQMFVVPLGKGIRYLINSPELRRHRRRAIGVTAAAAASVLLLLFAVPAPYATVVDGVVWVPERSVVRAGTDGFVQRILATPNEWVVAGQPLVELDDPVLRARVNVFEAELEVARLRFDAIKVVDQVQAEMLNEQVRHTEATLARHRALERELVIRSPTAGRFLISLPNDLPGRFVRQGDFVAYVAEPSKPLVRAAVFQDDVDLILTRTRRVDVRFADHLRTIVPARLSRFVPAATEELPSPALAALGGGNIATDPKDPRGARSIEKIFVLELGFAKSLPTEMLGVRAFIRFDHGMEPLAWRWLRSLRQLFLRELNV